MSALHNGFYGFPEKNEAQLALEAAFASRRRHPRLYGNFPATVRGVDIQGHAFKEQTCLSDLSASGLFLCLKHGVEVGSKIFIVFHFSISGRPAPRVAVQATVQRIETMASDDTDQGVAVRFDRHRFLGHPVESAAQNGAIREAATSYQGWISSQRAESVGAQAPNLHPPIQGFPTEILDDPSCGGGAF